MAALINNGLSGLLAAQRALQVTSNNVANATTKGYTRQRVELAERPAQAVGGGLSIGNGVGVAEVSRIYDQFLADELKSATMAQNRSRIVSALAGRVDNLLGNPDAGISQSVQAFFSQAEALNRDPSSAVNRQQLIAEGQSLAQRFAQLDSQLGQLGEEVNGRLEQAINRINDIAASLAQVNERITTSNVSNPNDLYDEQERLLTELAELIDFNAIRQPTGAVNVLAGNGQPLVLDVTAYELDMVQNEFDGTRMEVAYRGRNISNLITGGEVAGLLAVRSEVLEGAKRELGQLALGITEVFNNQHRLGVDLNGALGGDFFAAVTPISAASANNSGSAPVTVSIADPAGVEARDYVLRYNGSAWELSDISNGAPVSLSGTGTAGDPFLAGGLAIVVGAGAASGDRYRVSAVSGATSDIAVVLQDPRAIAAAGPLTTGVALTNLSDAKVSGASVDDIADPNLLRTVQIRFDDPTTYRILDGGGTDLSGPLAYTSGNDISFQGFTLQVSGSPMAGDVFNVKSTGAGSGDNTNALALSEIASKGFFNNGELSVTGVNANLVASVGSASARASSELSVQTLLRDQAELDLESVAGVNLEEEAVNMLRFQEAYLAASKIITVANELFQSLLGAIGR